LARPTADFAGTGARRQAGVAAAGAAWEQPQAAPGVSQAADLAQMMMADFGVTAAAEAEAEKPRGVSEPGA
jgi:hypothetical protein